MLKRTLFLLLPLLAFPLRAEPIRLSLREAVREALGTSTQARHAQSAEERAAIARREALGALFPQADARLLRYNQSINLETFGFAVPGQPPVVGPFNVTDAQLSAAVQLFNLAALRRYRALQEGERGSRLDTAAAENEVAAAVARLYILVQRGDARIESRRAEVELLERLLKLAQDEFDAGTGTKLDIAQANLQVARARQAVLAAENERQTAALAVLNAIGASQASDVIATDPLPSNLPTPVVDATVAKALENRPDLLALKSHQREAELNFSAQRARRLPSLAADFTGDYSGNSSNDLRWTRRVAGVVSVPLFHADVEANIARARLQLHDAQSDLAQRQRDVEEDVRRAIMNLQNATSRVAVAGDAANVAEQALTIARERRSAGYGSPVEVDRAEQAYREAREDLIAARADAAAAAYDVQRSTGEISTLSESPQ